MNKIIRNFSYTLTSNLTSLLVTALITLLIPRQLGIESYSYFQLYIFYTSYIGFFHFGWADGLLLRHAGAYYEDLNKPTFSGQFWMYSLLELILGIGISLAGIVLVHPEARGMVVTLTGTAVILTLPKTLILYILQATNRIKEYAALIISEKILSSGIVIFALLIDANGYVPFIIGDLLGKAVALFLGIYYCKDMISTKVCSLRLTITEMIANVSVGIKLMIANIASSLIIGFVRIAIERKWDITTFGKVSLTISISNLLMIFIRAISVVMFPLLRRAKQEHLPHLYQYLRTGLMVPLLGFLLIYYPIQYILSLWLPQYADSLYYMALLFPMCVFESKMSMLVETYLKTLRMEKWLMKINLLTFALSVIVTFFSVFQLANLDLAVCTIPLLLAFRCVCAEIILSTKMNINVRLDIFLELLLTAIFMAGNWVLGHKLGALIYISSYLVYLFVKRIAISETYNYMKTALKKDELGG